MEKRIVRVGNPLNDIGNQNSFAVIGDPGCEGLGTSMMRVYANALATASEEDFIIVAGDLVPVGEAGYYHTVCEITDAISEKEVYVLRGNHDTGAYESYFGLHNYALIGSDFTVIILDNACRRFEEEGLALLREVLSGRSAGMR